MRRWQYRPPKSSRCVAATWISFQGYAWNNFSCACYKRPRTCRRAQGRLLNGIRPSSKAVRLPTTTQSSHTRGGVMKLRSMLFVPGDSERKQAKAADVGADALILDLEDSVEVSRLPIAREMVHEYLKANTGTAAQLWVRIIPLDSGLALEDLAAVVRAAPAGILLPKVYGAAEIVELDRYLSALEARDGLTAGSIGILPVATETPQAMFA